MKNIIATSTFGLFVALTSLAAQPKAFTEAHYKHFKKNTGVELNISKNAAPVLNTYGASCAKAALASLTYSTFNLAEERGVDYPETIFVKNVKFVESMPGQTGFQLYSDKKIFSISMNPQAIPCIAYEATVSPEKINLKDLKPLR